MIEHIRSSLPFCNCCVLYALRMSNIHYDWKDNEKINTSEGSKASHTPKSDMTTQQVCKRKTTTKKKAKIMCIFKVWLDSQCQTFLLLCLMQTHTHKSRLGWEDDAVSVQNALYWVNHPASTSPPYMEMKVHLKAIFFPICLCLSRLSTTEYQSPAAPWHYSWRTEPGSLSGGIRNYWRTIQNKEHLSHDLRELKAWVVFFLPSSPSSSFSL